jgi:hypothetical protein
VGGTENPGLSFGLYSATAGNLHFGREGVKAGESQAQPYGALWDTGRKSLGEAPVISSATAN